MLAELLVLLRDLPGDQVTYRDALEVFTFFAEVRSQAQGNLLALRARWADQDDTGC